MTQSDLIGRAKILDTERNLCGPWSVGQTLSLPEGVKGERSGSRDYETTRILAQVLLSSFPNKKSIA